jgi:uncharacterized membrane protein
MKKYYALIAAMLAGLALRLYSLAKISLWHDEAFSALMLRYSWPEMLHRIAEDVHPPLYYIILRFWVHIFGESVFSLRGFSVACGVAAIILAYYLVEKYFTSRKAAILAAIFLAVNFFQIYRGSLEARMYTLGVLLALSATASLLTALHSTGSEKKTWLLYLLFSIFGASLLYTHYYLAFNLIALGLYGLGYHIKNYGWQWRRYLPFISSCLFVGVLFLPWLKTFMFQLGQVQGGYWIWPMTRWSIPNTFWDLSFAWESSTVPSHWMLILITLAAVALMFGFIRSVRQKEKWLVLISIIAPFAGSLLFLIINRLQGHTSSVFLIRYFVLIGPFYLMAIALWLTAWRRIRFAWTIAGVIILLNLVAFTSFWHDQRASTKPGMAGVTAYLNQYANSSNDKIIVGTAYEYFNSKYYLKTQNPSRLYTNGRSKVSEMAHFEGTALLSDADLVSDLKTAAVMEDTVWIIWTQAYSSSKPIVPVNWVQIQEKGYEDIQPYLGTVIYLTEYRVN